MFDDLRQSALEPIDLDAEEEPSPPKKDDDQFEQEPEGKGFLGLTAPQRFVLSLALLLMTCVLSGICLVLTEKVVLPIY